jgi:hypothetical protein
MVNLAYWMVAITGAWKVEISWVAKLFTFFTPVMVILHGLSAFGIATASQDDKRKEEVREIRENIVPDHYRIFFWLAVIIPLVIYDHCWLAAGWVLMAVFSFSSSDYIRRM